MTVKILTCNICGKEIESRSLWANSITVHLFNHKGVHWFQVPASILRKKYFTERTIKVPDKITEAPHYGTTTDY